MSPEEVFARAKALMAEGRFGEAEPLLRSLLAMAPKHPGLLQRLSEICYRTSRVREAATLLRQAVEAVPGNAAMLSSLGLMLHQLGDSEAALPFLTRAVAIQPGAAPVHTNLGIVYAALKRQEEALAAFETASRLDPRLAAPRNNAGNVLMALGRIEEAKAAFEQAIAIDPTFVEARNNLGNALFHLGRSDEAVTAFAAALARNPAYAPAHYNWATVLAERGAHDEAAQHYTRAREIDPGYVAACHHHGYSLNALGRPNEAIKAFCQALALDPADALAHAGIGASELCLGNTHAARAAYETALRLAPDEPVVHRALGEVKRYTPGDPDIAQMEAIAARALDASATAQLHFALFKAYADTEDYARAFACLSKANAAKRSLISYDEPAHLAEMVGAAETYSAERLAQKGGAPSQSPIFIFGMPRSGTSLIEQILASHPAVHGAGEAVEFGRLVMGTYRPGASSWNVATLSEPERRHLGQTYLDAMAAKAPAGTLRITDKMPANFRFAGAIAMTLPGARMIHLRRDAMDTCFSCYSKLFTGSIDYAYDLGELGRYYRSYERLVAYWRVVLPPSQFLEMCYEDLVSDLEAGTRTLLDFCGLAWDPACLEFHKTTRPVITASMTQVRQPLFKSGIGRWKLYAEWLSPLREVLQHD